MMPLSHGAPRSAPTSLAGTRTGLNGKQSGAFLAICEIA
jgi:hypothetical protein